MLKLTMISFIILLTTASSVNAVTLASTQPKINSIQPSEITLSSSTLFESLNPDEKPDPFSTIPEKNLKNAEESLEIHEGSLLLGLLFIGLLGGIQLLFSHLIMSDCSNHLTQSTH
jgi:hypothetical protein